MANTTETLELITPEAEDRFSIAHFNENMETLDANAAANAEVHETISDSLENINNKIGTSADTGNTTVFGKLNNSTPSAIKSIQYKTKTLNYDNKTATISISTVTPSKCLVIFERLYDSTEFSAKVSYTLSASSLSVTADLYSNSMSLILGFWIIEFN